MPESMMLVFHFMQPSRSWNIFETEFTLCSKRIRTFRSSARTTCSVFKRCVCVVARIYSHYHTIVDDRLVHVIEEVSASYHVILGSFAMSRHHLCSRLTWSLDVIVDALISLLHCCHDHKSSGLQIMAFRTIRRVGVSLIFLCIKHWGKLIQNPS